MGKQNITLEDILSEYSQDPAPREKEAPKGSAAPQKPAPAPVKAADDDNVSGLPRKDYVNAFAEAQAQRTTGGQKPHYADRRPPMELNRTKVSFIQSAAMETDSLPSRVNAAPKAKPKTQEPPKPPAQDDTPKIRRMSDSTRAKEREKRKKRKHKLSEEEAYTYDRERPDGEYMYTQIRGAKRARNRKKVSERPTDITAVGTETIHDHFPDLVHVTGANTPEPVAPVDIKPAPRAEKTSINLTPANEEIDPASLDVSISRTPEEAEEETRRRQQLSDRMELENAADIRSDIEELRNSISFRNMALMLVLLISLYLTLGPVFSVAWIENLSAGMLCTIQLLLGFAAAVVCAPVLKNGFKRLVLFHADTDSLAAVSITGCLIASLMGAIHPETALPQYMPCAILILLLHSIGKTLIVSREETNLRLATRRFDCHGLTVVEDEQRAEAITRGVLGDFPILATMRRTDELSDFRKYTYSADLADRFCHVAAPLSLLASAVIAAGLTVLQEQSAAYGWSMFSMLAVGCGCAAITLVVNLPLFKATRRMAKNGALMLGYQSVEDFYDTNALMMDASAMFPDGSVKLAGVKMYSDIKMDETLLAAASLARHAGSVFSSIFKEVLAGKETRLYKVENYVYEDSMGLCGWINNQRVLLGNRELMVSHNIEGIPSKPKEAELLGSNKEAVYLSVSGNLSALFLVELHADKNIKFWAKQIQRHSLCLILRSVDPMITLHRISELFDIPQDMVKLIPNKLSREYEEETKPQPSLSVSMACNGSFSSMAELIIGTKTVRKASVLGIVLQAASILFGIAIVLMQVILHVGLTPLRMMIFHGIVALLTLLAVNIRRNY